MRNTVGEMSKTFSKESVKALDNRAREELERLTTDTARSVADFLYDRDRDILLAAQLEPNEAMYQRFVENRNRNLTEIGQWRLAADGKGWEQVGGASAETKVATPSNAENKQDFHYRPPETVLRTLPRPLYHEITYVALDGHEKLKISRTNVLPHALRDVSRKENTWCKAETYFAELKKLKPGQIYVSDVIGPYVPSRVIGPATPEKANKLGIPFEPEKEAYAGRENPKGKHFQGIVRWATPVVKGGNIVGYVTLALDHTHVMSFTDNLMPTAMRYTAISDATNGNYAFMWDYLDRNIAHPRHHSIVGLDPKTGQYATPWLEASIYEGWQQSGKPLSNYLKTITPFDQQTREKKPAAALTKAGNLGLQCRYLNFAPQCQGWHDLTQYGGSGSFLILWSGVWKLTTAATIPYHTGQYANTARGFGYVTIGANVNDFHQPALSTALLIDAKVTEFGEQMKAQQASLRKLIVDSANRTGFNLIISTLIMLLLVVFVAIWLASVLTRRITDLIDGLARIEAGNFSFRFKRESNDELGKLSDSLNTMAGSVEESFRRAELTAEVNLARELAEESTRMKSAFLANMSHEIRTPMNGIIGLTHLTLMTQLTPHQQDYLKKIQLSGQHLLRIINDILDISKIEAGKLSLEHTDFELETTLSSVVNLISESATEKGIELVLDVGTDVPVHLIGDSLRLGQILLNYANNAIKFTEHGEINIVVRVRERNEDNALLWFAVRDTGIGLSDEQKNRLFTAFSQANDSTTREYGGTGLGLAISKQLALMMEGDVGVDSVLDVGSTFWFTARLGIGQQVKRELLPEPDLRGRRVLVVDDNDNARLVMQEMLSSMSFKVDVVTSGRDAVMAVKQADHEQQPYELIFMDWQMPGMNGIEACRLIQALSLAEPPHLLLVTAYGREQVFQQAKDAGIKNVLIKPLNASMLFDSAMRVLHGDASEQQSTTEINSASFDKLASIVGARILLVEDNDINQQVALEILHHAGFEVDLAEDGQVALDQLKKKNYALVLMDMQMPVMDGIEATQLLRKMPGLSNLPVVAMTANAQEVDRQRCLEAGMHDFLTKPIEPERLWQTLLKWIPAIHSSTPSAGLVGGTTVAQTEQKFEFEIEGIDTAPALKRILGNTELYKKMLRQFCQQQKNTPELINIALNANNWTEARRQAHTLKGVAASIGADHLAEQATNLENGLIQQLPRADLNTLLTTLEVELRELLIALLNKLPPTTVAAKTGTINSGNAVASKLARLLNENNSEAITWFENNSAALQTILTAERFDALKAAINDYEFEQALRLLCDSLPNIKEN
jgi:signal transduction histidine kinase/DNA-binding response OmpR family regulator/HPt (histidine-containing phosphotransfer) domain-containing protein